MRHVDHEGRADTIRDGAEALVVPMARIGRAARDDDLRADRLGLALDRVHVDPVRLGVDAVGLHLEPAPRHVDRRAVREVATGREVEPHEGVARLHQGQEHGLVGLRARVRLDVGEAAAEQFGRAPDGEVLGDVDELAAAVVALPRIAFRVFVGHHRALRFEHGAGHDVLGGDQLDLVALAAEFQLHRAGDLGIRLGEAGAEEAVRQGRVRPGGVEGRDGAHGALDRGGGAGPAARGGRSACASDPCRGRDSASPPPRHGAARKRAPRPIGRRRPLVAGPPPQRQPDRATSGRSLRDADIGLARMPRGLGSVLRP